MTKTLALGLGAALAILAMSGAAQAQSVIQVHGTIQAVDCTANTLTLNAPGGSQTFQVTTATAVFVDSTTASFCGLSQYVRSPATVWVTAQDGQLVVGRVDVAAALAPAPGDVVPQYQPAPYYGPYYGPDYGPYYDGPGYYPFFNFGIGIGPGFDDREFHHHDFDHDRGHDRGGRGGGDFGHDGHGGGRGGDFGHDGHGGGRGGDFGHGGPGGGRGGDFGHGGHGGGQPMMPHGGGGHGGGRR
jgi:hypothetical protein